MGVMVTHDPTRLRLARDDAAAPARELATSVELVFRDHYGFVHRTLRAFGVVSTQTDDAAQEVFLIVHRRLADFDGRGTMRAWLYGIARRVARDHRRGSERRRRRLELVKRPEEPVLPDDQLARREAAAFVERFLAELKDAQREVFVLMEIEGLSAPEVVDCTGMKLNTVYSRQRKARRRFERALTRHRAGEARHG
jgi:RNA polymerase sigma-70 factor (ECF subfamily)